MHCERHAAIHGNTGAVDGVIQFKSGKRRALATSVNLATRKAWVQEKLPVIESRSNENNVHFSQPVLQLRVALTVHDYERSVKFYCEGLGIEPAAIWDNDGGRALMLELGNATLEIFDERQAEVIDQLEAEQRVSGQIRFALQVPDLEAATKRLLERGATLVHPPVKTPWGDDNVRLQDPDGMQITLFEVRSASESDQ